MQINYINLSQIDDYASNSNTHPDEQLFQIERLVLKFGWTMPVLVKKKENGRYELIAGHGRKAVALRFYERGDNFKTSSGFDVPKNCIPAIEANDWSEDAVRAYVIADNAVGRNSKTDEDILTAEITLLKESDFDLDYLALDEDYVVDLLKVPDEDFGADKSPAIKLTDSFLVPPFSLLNAREPWWKKRKKQWLNIGLKKAINEKSVFDPVLCELVYRWFCPPGGQVLDCFAGGSVKGVVASRLGLNYTGLGNLQKQVVANRRQSAEITKSTGASEFSPSWTVGNPELGDFRADFIFSVAALELGSGSYAKFKRTYRQTIKKSCDLLTDNSFACMVVGEVRNADGNYHNFVGDTVEAFKAAGLSFYNEAILLSPAGTLSMRTRKPFEGSRKLGKTHLNVLVFVKGDAKLAAERCGDVDVNDVFDLITEDTEEPFSDEAS